MDTKQSKPDDDHSFADAGDSNALFSMPAAN